MLKAVVSPKLERAATLDYDLAKQVKSADTNPQMRYKAAEFLKNVDGINTGFPTSLHWGPGPYENDYSSADVQGLRDWAEDIPKPANIALRKLEKDYQDLRKAYNGWKTSYAGIVATLDPSSGTPPANAEQLLKYLAGADAQVNQLLAIANEQRTGVRNDLSEIKLRLGKARDMFIAIMDSPAYKDYPCTPTKDELKIVVQVKEKTAGGEESAPETPKAGGGGDSATKDASTADTSGTKPSRAEETIPVYGRWILDYSLGLAGTNLKKRNYIVGPKNPPTDFTTVIQEGASDRLDIGAAALAHFYCLKDQSVTPAITFGVVAKDPVRYLLGVTAVIGGTHRTGRTRVFLTYGLAVGKVERLNGVSVGDTTTASEIKTVSVQRQGTFLAASANFSF